MCLFEGGEHGKLAARLATQVIKAYVDKQRRQPAKVASNGQVDVGVLWNGAGEEGDALHGGHLLLDGGGEACSPGRGGARDGVATATRPRAKHSNFESDD